MRFPQSYVIFSFFAVWAQKVYPVDLKDAYNEYERLNVTSEERKSTFEAPQLIYAVEELKDGVCKTDLGKYVHAISEQEKWAMIMFDSSVKFPNGLLHGQMHQLGNYDECVYTKFGDAFEKQYCLAHVLIENSSFVPTKNKKYHERNVASNIIHWAFCLPKSCSQDESQIILQTLFNKVMNLEGLNIVGLSCTINEPVEVNTLDIIYVAVLGVFLSFVLLATGYHGLHIYTKANCTQYSLDRARKDYSVWHEIVLAFSLIKNFVKIIEVKAKNKDFNLDCICGLKVISMFLIICGHALIFLITSPTINSNFAENEIYKPQYSIFLNNTLFVDSFLLTSGFLMSRLLILEYEKRNGKVNIFILYVARYIRLTPAYIVVIGFYMTYLIKLGDGPLWNDTISKEQNRCLSSWWSNILYVNNYVNTNDFCMFQSWYLSVDSQLFIIAPFIIQQLWKRPVIGQWILSVIIFLTATLTFLCTYFYELDPTLMVYISELQDLTKNSFFINTYIKTHMRANTYFLGILFGYIVHRSQASGYKLPYQARIIGWGFSLMCGLSALFSAIFLYSSGYEYNRLNAAIYSPLHRICWCILIGWTIFITVVYNDGFVNKLLSWKLWGPFSRLTYCAYLVNGIVELYSYGVQRVPKYMSVFTMASETISHVVLTFLLAFILCLLFESPIHNLEKIVLKMESSKKRTQPEVENSI